MLNFLSLSVLAALFATLAGALLALWLRYNGPDTSLSFEMMIDILLIVVIGGMETMYARCRIDLVIAQSFLQDAMKLSFFPSGIVGRRRAKSQVRIVGVDGPQTQAASARASKLIEITLCLALTDKFITHHASS